MNVGAVDIGTNSMRLMIIDESGAEVARDSEVTGLGTGVDATGHFDEQRMAVSLEVMQRFGDLMDAHGTQVRVAVATSATRDAHNGAEFVTAVADRLGVTPEVISGQREAQLAFAGAISSWGDGRCVVVDIGGGSTEFIVGSEMNPGSVGSAVSIDIGAVRLTDRLLPDRPASDTQIHDARAHVRSLFREVVGGPGIPAIGVAGTFTSLAAMALDLSVYDRAQVDGAELSLGSIEMLIERLSGLSVEQTAAIPALQPKRAPVILAGAVIAAEALRQLGVATITVSESDLLDALAAEALAEAVAD